MRRRAVFAVLAALVVGAAPLAGQNAIDCERCHGEAELLRQHVESLDAARTLLVPERMIEGSAHAGMSCADCHSGFRRFPHPAAATTESCASCHEEAYADWQSGLHSGTADTEAVGCVECHSVHAVLPADSLREGAAVRAMSETCTGCHETQRLPADAHHQDHAGCYACHNPHGVLAPDDPESWMAPLNQPEVCGACHDSVATVYAGGAHARALRSGTWEATDAAPPTCTSCHGAHPVAGSGDVPFEEAAVERCEACHEWAAETYRGTYHGKAAELGSNVAATCAECHGAHGMEPASAPTSRVAEANLVATCGECHEHARPAFVQYDSHPDPMDRERNPVLFYSFWFMNSLLLGTLTVFGLHTLLWWIRIMIDRRKGVTHHGGGGE
ncbi:MAG: cytochrome c3 family protein [Gemmatimonadota bacterium]